ncbi:NAD-dependent dehydratase [Rhodococcus sp. WMMA185]|uniref:NAD-dependent epimerase/dehydratase family protein n=1 Tax=Rhodococcus sp. WMMA185 TaxID=679318 RepID=UPI00087919E3|nr:NAD-dependent epimerase/dehydratase family protein [Rhodococcus sp. WMMA185]AOW93686.1 NAD-dependent dehydratase [Rhodococcus sp. WMMA185]
MTPTRILLTGAAGFIGSHVHTLLSSRGHDVVAVDALLPSAHGTESEEPESVRRVDVRDLTTLKELLSGVDVVCHQAAVVGAGVNPSDAPAYASHNDLGNATVLAAMHETGCHRLVLASSMVVYGDGRYRNARGETVLPAPRRPEDLAAGNFDTTDPASGEALDWELVEEDSPLRPRSLYAASKVAQENYALAWSLATGGSVTALRYHNVYGEHMPRGTPYSGVAAMFRSSLEAGEPPRVFEDGRQMRDFVHVHDVASANVAAIEAALTGFSVFNVCSGRPISIGEVAATLAQACEGPEPVVTGEYRPGDVRHIVASPELAGEVLGFRAQIPPETGLAAFAHAPLRSATPAGPPRV